MICKTGLVPMFKGEAQRIVLEQSLVGIDLEVTEPCSDCGRFHVRRINKELCKVCGGTVDIIINKGTGICSERCKKMDELIKKYAAELETIYNERIAGDNTFDGVLYKFAQEAKELLEK